MSLTIKFALFTSALCLVIISGIIFLSYRISKNELEASLGLHLEAIVRSGAFGLDGDLHDQVQSGEDATGEAFTTLRGHLLRLKRANDLNTEVYTFRRRGEQLEFVVMTNEKPFIGDAYSIRPEMLPTLNKGQATHTGAYGDANGMWISAYAPILDSNGHISGLLEADYEVHTFLELLQQKFRALLWKGAIFGLIAVALSFLLAGRVTKKLVYLTEVTEKISLGKMETPIRVKGKDEVSRLGASLERMRESLLIAARMME